MTTNGGFELVYPTPGFVIAILTTFPLSFRTAVPIDTKLPLPKEDVPTLTLTVCTPTLYPDPLLPIETEEIVPTPETTAVPPAPISGW